jgi:hypothetical protein
MSTRAARALKMFLLLGVSMGVMAGAAPVAAQTYVMDKDESCVACHENLYLLHDTGKWYCLHETKAHCTFCHGGVVGALDEATAHMGMIARPVQTAVTVCETCHPSDYRSRISTFVVRAGVSSIQIPPTPVVIPAPVQPEVPVSGLGLEPWQRVALALLVLAFVGLIYFGYRCWRTDCIARGARS